MLGSYQRGWWSRCHQVQLFIIVVRQEVCPLPKNKEYNCVVTDALKNHSACQKVKCGGAFLWCSGLTFLNPITACFSMDEAGEYPLHVLCKVIPQWPGEIGRQLNRTQRAPEKCTFFTNFNRNGATVSSLQGSLNAVILAKSPFYYLMAAFTQCPIGFVNSKKKKKNFDSYSVTKPPHL